ncbi:hypothetical protein KC878_04615 [Candidatus Saccharibacteria bacterium]|nr:hypothetical protein [Candidatus Saccharibacteria bacterium]MCB9821214.1 hypothetical protein [Candidatus Nomurabacteria bacterium]
MPLHKYLETGASTAGFEPANELMVLVPLAKFPDEFGGDNQPWPRHITVLAPAKIPAEQQLTAIGVVAEVAHANLASVIQFGESEDFSGSDAQPVAVERARLRLLHIDLLQALKNAGVDWPIGEWAGAFYNPHSSGQREIDPALTIPVWTLMVIGKYALEQGGSTKRVLDASRMQWPESQASRL